jgi:AcrR family transcriptional regulator
VPQHTETPADSPSKGERTRSAILERAANLATTEGLEGLTIGQLAKATGMSKSGLYAHFGSKKGLQLATIERAEEIFRVEVIDPALGTPPGSGRLIALCDAFLSYVERKVFPGGCFFAAAAIEVGRRRGPVHEMIASIVDDWRSLLEQSAREAGKAGELPSRVDPAQLAFELYTLLVGANSAWVLTGESAVIERGRRAVRERVTRGVDPAAA